MIKISKKKKFIKRWEEFKNSSKKITDKLTGGMKEKLDVALGIYIHKNISTIFFWDKKVQRLVKEINQLAREGKKDEAIHKSELLKGHVIYLIQHDRRAQKKLDEISDFFKGKSEMIKSKFSKMNPVKLLKMLKKGDMDADDD